MTRPAYPEARRSDDADALHGTVVRDPYRWLEDPDDPSDRGVVGRAGRAARRPSAAALAAAATGCAARVGRAARRRASSARRPGAASGSSSCAARPSRSTRCCSPSTRTAPSGCSSTRSRIDPSGTHHPGRLAAVQGGRPARLPALRGRHRGVGAARHGRRHRRAASTARSTARATPPSPGCPAARRTTTSAGCAPEQVPADEEQYHRRVWLHRRRHRPRRRRLVFGDGPGHDQLLRRHRCRWTAAGWSIGASAGTAPRNDLWLADLSDGRARARRTCGSCRRASTRRRRCTSAATAGSTSSPTATRPRGRLVRDRPRRPDVRRPGPTSSPRTPRRCSRATRSSTARSSATAACCSACAGPGTRSARSPSHDLRDRRAHAAPSRCPGSARSAASPSGPRAATRRGSATPTTSTPSSVYRYDARTGETTLWATAPGHASRCPRCTPARSSTPRPTAPRCGCSCSSPTRRRRTGRGPTILYGYGGFGIPLTPGYSAGRARLGRGRRRLRDRQPARRRRGGRGVAPRRHAGHKQNVFDDFHAAAERLVADGWTTTDAAGHLRRLQRRPAGRRRADPAARAVRGRRLLGAAARHGALRAVRARRDLERRVRHAPTCPRSSAGCWPTRRTTTSARASTTRPSLFTVFDGDTRVDPLHARKMCAALQHATGGTRPVLLRRERDVGHGARALSRSVALTADTLGFARAGHRPRRSADVAHSIASTGYPTSVPWEAPPVPFAATLRPRPDAST